MPNEAAGARTRVMQVKVPHDAYGAAGETPLDLISKSGPTEGALLLDNSGRRNWVRISGDLSRYEISVALLPGWPPALPLDYPGAGTTIEQMCLHAYDDAAWSVDGPIGELKLPGRYWVLNEDGGCRATAFRRYSGPWSTAAVWRPFDFASALIADLQVPERDKLWSARRRQFLAPLALMVQGTPDATANHYDHIGKPVVEFSFDSGATWYVEEANVAVLGDRCGIVWKTADLRTIADPAGTANPYNQQPENFITCYIQGKLRVRITALVEGDRATYGHERGGTEFPLTWAQHLDRRGQFLRDIRSSGSNRLWSNGGLGGGNYVTPADRNDSLQAWKAAQRMLSESEILRSSGQITVPYLLRPDPAAAWDSYDIGDELKSVETQDGTTRFEVQTGDSEHRRAPRVIGLTYRWGQDPPEMSTTIQVEDRTYGPDDVLAPQMSAPADGQELPT
jgi:hypothetical protein